MATTIRIGTRESQLAQWQATEVKNLLAQYGYSAELILIKSEGDIFKPVLGKGINLEQALKKLNQHVQ